MNKHDWNMLLGFPKEWDFLGDIQDWFLPPFNERIIMETLYNKFLKKKEILIPNCGIEVDSSIINPLLFDFQKDIVRWCLRKGKSAIFSMTGTGKTLMQCEWAKHIQNYTNGKIIIFAPLAVSHQTIQEAKKLDILVNYCKEKFDVKSGINITNYERIYKFNPQSFQGIILDESSILKSLDGKIKSTLVEEYKFTPYKLACTATPAPNDFMELGNHAEFLNVMGYKEMLSMFFVHDGGDTSKWRLKKHAHGDFWDWLAKWSVVLTKPSDLEYDDDGFILPPLNIHHVKVESNYKLNKQFLIPVEAGTLQERQEVRRKSIPDRIKKCIEIVNKLNEPVLIWCDYNSESFELARTIRNSAEIKGSDSNDYKERTMLDFSNGKVRILITKPSIAGFGMNWQHCSKIIFFGLSDSFEQYFQAVRRCYRFGQKKEVDVFVIISNLEGNVVENIKRKESNAMKMLDEMVLRTKDTVSSNIRGIGISKTKYEPSLKMELPSWLK